MFALGSKAQDKVSGFTGTITARAEYLYSNNSYQLEGLEGNQWKSNWYEEPRLEEIIEKEKVAQS